MAELRITRGPERGDMELVWGRKDHGRGYMTWNSRLRAILHPANGASKFPRKAMLAMCHYTGSTKAFHIWEQEQSNSF